MHEFDIDDLKNSWQQQKIQGSYGSPEIRQMLNRKSRNYVKYIFWISAAEFLLFMLPGIFYFFRDEGQSSFMQLLTRLGVEKTESLQLSFDHLYFLMKVVSQLVTGFFMVKFYLNYRKINVENNLKNLIQQIISFRKTANHFILANFGLLMVFSAALLIFIFTSVKSQQVVLSDQVFTGLIAGIVVTVLVTAGLIWLYYRVVYGIIIKRLGKNLEQLQALDEAENLENF